MRADLASGGPRPRRRAAGRGARAAAGAAPPRCARAASPRTGGPRFGPGSRRASHPCRPRARARAAGRRRAQRAAARVGAAPPRAGAGAPPPLPLARGTCGGAKRAGGGAHVIACNGMNAFARRAVANAPLPDAPLRLRRCRRRCCAAHWYVRPLLRCPGECRDRSHCQKLLQVFQIRFRCRCKPEASVRSVCVSKSWHAVGRSN